MTLVHDSTRPAAKAALTVGYLCLAFAFVRAHQSPMTGYEVSIYAATPLSFWIGVAVAGVLALAVLTYARDSALFGAASVLYLGATMAVVTLPLTRGYSGYGQGDAQTHLGWMREILEGTMSVLELVYPGTHVDTILVHTVTGMALPRAMILAVGLFAFVYLLFVPLVVRTVVGDRSAVAIALVAASLLLPVTNISTYLDYHPFTLATFAFPVVLYFLLRYLAAPTTGAGLADLRTRTGKFLVFVLFALVLLHPQVALNALILAGTVAVVQSLSTRLPGTEGVGEGRRLLAPTILASALFALWALRYEVVTRMFGYVLTAVGEFWESSGGNTGETVQQNSGSLSEIGVTIFEIFGKLFAVHFVFSVLAGLMVLGLVAGRLDRMRSQRNDVVTYFAYGAVTLTPFFLLHFIGNISGYFFRHVGFAMVIVTILAAFALHGLHGRLEERDLIPTARPIAVVLAICVVAFSLFTVFPSPFLYQATPGVPAAEASGYQTAFQYDGPETPYSGLRQGPGRFEDALNAEVPSADSITAENITAGRLGETAEESYFLVVSDYDREVEVTAFRGIDYNRTAFESLRNAPSVSRTMSNGGMVIYHVTPDGGPPEADGTDGSTPTSENGSDVESDPETETPSDDGTDTPAPNTETSDLNTDTPTPEPDTPVPDTETAAPDTDTPEPETPAPDTDTPAPDTDTLEPDTETPPPDTETETPSPDADTPDPDTPSGGGDQNGTDDGTGQGTNTSGTDGTA